ncbi:MAG TPA: hypothetical protein VII90_09880 [Anaerolineales bacterium]
MTEGSSVFVAVSFGPADAICVDPPWLGTVPSADRVCHWMATRVWADSVSISAGLSVALVAGERLHARTAVSRAMIGKR